MKFIDFAFKNSYYNDDDCKFNEFCGKIDQITDWTLIFPGGDGSANDSDEHSWMKLCDTVDMYHIFSNSQDEQAMHVEKFMDILCVWLKLDCHNNNK